MSSTNNNIAPHLYGALRGLSRRVLRALVVSGWMWIPGVPPQEFFGNPWPYERPDAKPPVRPEEHATVASSRP